jgi:hypothetical protein
MIAALAIAIPVSAQYIYLDTNNDSLNTWADSLNSVGSTAVDIWLNTGANRDGSPGLCGSAGFMTYEFILRAVGGTMSWGTFSGSIYSSLTASNPTENHIAGPGAGAPLGLHKLGTLNVEVASGRPCLVFATSTTLAPWHATSFGSACLGQRFDHTPRLGTDWSDSDGLPLSPSTSPNVSAPGIVVPKYLDPVVVDVQAAITGCGISISSLSANLTALPAGNNAVFTPAPGNLGGTLTWQPTATDRGEFPVTFTARGLNPASQSSRTTIIHLVTDPVAVEEPAGPGPAFALWQNRPNPFNPMTTIVYSVPGETHVRLVVYDLSGRVAAKLVDRVESLGRHEVHWTGEDARGRPLASGVYLYRLTTAFGTESRRLVLAR